MRGAGGGPVVETAASVALLAAESANSAGGQSLTCVWREYDTGI